MPRRLLAALVLAAMLVGLAAPAWAITFGQRDTANAFPNVGALIGEFEGDHYIFCTGTLIPDRDGGQSNIFLTAAHCLEPGLRMWVTFQPFIDLDADTGAIAPATPLLPGTAHPHPDFACCGLSDPFDIGVVVLDAPVAGIAPAPIATANQLDSMSNQELKGATFVTAGYGTVREDKTRGTKSFFFDGDRRWVTQTANSLQKAWLTLSMNPSTGDGGTCYGDSGGPHFLNGVVVSLTSIGDVPCRASDRTYRVDTAVARAFLSTWVALP